MPYRVVTDRSLGFEVQYHSGNGNWRQCHQVPDGSGVNTLSSEFRAELYIVLRKSEANRNVGSDYVERKADAYGLP